MDAGKRCYGRGPPHIIQLACTTISHRFLPELGSPTAAWSGLWQGGWYCDSRRDGMANSR
jgi:hypothetical protein